MKNKTEESNSLKSTLATKVNNHSWLIAGVLLLASMPIERSV